MNKYLVSIAALLLLVGAGCESGEETREKAENEETNARVEETTEAPEKTAAAEDTAPSKIKAEDEDGEENENEDEEEEENEGKTVAPVTKPTTVTPPATTVKTFTMAEVQAANNQDKCWSVVSGKVYDLTPFTPKHPGGDKAILSLCGKDGTKAFQGQHGSQSNPNMQLGKHQIGILK